MNYEERRIATISQSMDIPYPRIVQKCRVDPIYDNIICSDKNFWMRKFNHDFYNVFRRIMEEERYRIRSLTPPGSPRDFSPREVTKRDWRHEYETFYRKAVSHFQTQIVKYFFPITLSDVRRELSNRPYLTICHFPLAISRDETTDSVEIHPCFHLRTDDHQRYTFSSKNLSYGSNDDDVVVKSKEMDTLDEFYYLTDYFGASDFIKDNLDILLKLGIVEEVDPPEESDEEIPDEYFNGKLDSDEELILDDQ